MTEKVTFESLSHQELKKGRTEHVNTTRIVSQRPCFILDWEITAKVNGTGFVQFYDGHSPGVGIAMDISVTKDSSLCQDYTFPRYFSQGLYIVLGGDVKWICLHYLPEPVM